MLFGAKLARARARRRRQSRQRARRRHDPAGQGAAAPGTRRDRPARQAARPRLDAHQRHQRQDDDRGDDRRRARGRRPPPGPQPGRLEHDLGRRHGAARAAGDEGLFEVDEAWLPKVAAQLDPSPDRARQPLPRPARPLRRDGGAGGGLGEDRRRAGRPHPLRAQRRRSDDRRPRPRRRTASPREGVVYFGIEDASQALPELQHAFDAKHCRRCGHPYAYERAFVGHLGHYSCPNCGAPRPRPTSPRRRSSCAGCRARG